MPRPLGYLHCLCPLALLAASIASGCSAPSTNRRDSLSLARGPHAVSPAMADSQIAAAEGPAPVNVLTHFQTPAPPRASTWGKPRSGCGVGFG
jgi:hypothetical protein